MAGPKKRRKKERSGIKLHIGKAQVDPKFDVKMGPAEVEKKPRVSVKIGKAEDVNRIKTVWELMRPGVDPAVRDLFEHKGPTKIHRVHVNLKKAAKKKRK